MKIQTYDYNKNETRFFETPFTLKQYIEINFGMWFFYDINKIKANHYTITDKFTGEVLYDVTKV